MQIFVWYSLFSHCCDFRHEIQDPEETSSPPTSRHRSRQGGEKKINQIKFLIHQEKKLSPEYLK